LLIADAEATASASVGKDDESSCVFGNVEKAFQEDLPRLNLNHWVGNSARHYSHGPHPHWRSVAPTLQTMTAKRSTVAKISHKFILRSRAIHFASSWMNNSSAT